ncbi:hypothetical protein PIROE2DRAFT_5542 [Piromyces sp. E2]|nr:hypothetical protein PIROE2DRAFT_5542 [Piromyces sp. E2]|eukprot:OUM67057.1 hypothetical protein PIROE2DRAFT_5542 [Piromyces sp. E2]
MVSLVKKFKNMYKGSYYYANKKYGKYTKRRPFPNFNDFDCSPSGDFSLNEVPDMRKMDTEKKNNYINTSNDNNTAVNNEGSKVYISSGNTATGDILGLGKGLYSTTTNSVSPVSTISDSSTDFTMVNGNSNDYSSNNPNNPFQSQSENKNPFNDASEISFSSGYSTTFDGMYPSSTSPKDFIGGDVSRRSPANISIDDIKYEYNGKNNWNAEIKRYYPSMPQTEEPVDYHDNYRSTKIPEASHEKKKKWWKKVIPSKKNKHQNDSVISESTYYNDSIRDFDGNPKRYDSKMNSSFYNSYSSDHNRSFSNISSTYSTSKYDYNRYNENLTDGVLVVNNNYQTKKIIY